MEALDAYTSALAVLSAALRWSAADSERSSSSGYE